MSKAVFVCTDYLLPADEKKKKSFINTAHGDNCVLHGCKFSVKDPF